MARGVDQVEGIGFAIRRLVVEADGTGLDGDATLPFQIHVIEDLIFHDTLFDGTTLFDQTVGERGFAVVNMGNDGEIANV